MKRFFLIYWPEENCVSIVSEKDVVSDAQGNDCKVRVGRKWCLGKIEGSGKSIIYKYNNKLLCRLKIYRASCIELGLGLLVHAVPNFVARSGLYREFVNEYCK